ncbi:MAG: DUF4159 domain-containing protein [Tepidisphaeraceae bacterium]
MRTCSFSRVVVHCLLVVAATCAVAAPPEQQVESAIDRGVKWLLEQNKTGSWEEVATPSGADYEPNGRQWGGRTGLATYALLAAGQSDQEPRVKQAIEFLKKAELQGTYALGLRCQVWYFLPNNPETRALVTKDAQALQACIRIKGKAHGLFRYWKGSGDDDYCHSCSNYGVLGLWACAQQNYEISPQQWSSFEDAWRHHQRDEGGWSYRNDDPSEGASKQTMSMTAAGVATLFITQDYVHAMEGIGCVGNPWDPHIHHGIQWISQNFDKFEEQWPFYALYNVERVGVASGMKFFGTVDWYDRGAKWILARQDGSGSWSNSVIDTSFALLFLVRGRSPLVMSKLDYTPEDFMGKNPRNIPAVWNQRSRDCANISRWIGRTIEKDLNWQIVHLKAPLEDLHDAPILYIAGSKELTFVKEDREKLKAWVLQGGLIVGNADCGKAGFADSFKKIGEELFAPCKFRELPADHLIFKDEAFKRVNWKNPPQLLGISNGAREFMVLFPTADPARYWQQQSFLGPEREPLAQLMGNIFLYSVDKQNLQHRGEPFLIQKKPDVKPVRTIKVARIQYDGNWDPEPYGWQRLAALMHNTCASLVEVTALKLGDNKLTKDFQAAHLTGTEAFTLSPLSRVELRKWLEAGGTLIVDACGGSKEFAQAAEAEIHDLYPAARLDILKSDSLVYNPVQPGIAEVGYRAFFIRNYARMKTPRLRGMDVNKRTAIIFSAEDLSTGLVGQPVDGILGYVPASASQLMSYALLYAAGVRPPPPPEAPKPEAFNLAEALEKFAPGWTGTGCFKLNDPGFKEQLGGRENVLVTTALDARNTVVLGKQQGVPPGRVTTLNLVVGHPEKGSWDLTVRADGQEIYKAPINRETTLNGWREISVDLSSFAGKEIKLELVQIPSPGAADKSAWWGLVKIQAKKE